MILEKNYLPTKPKVLCKNIIKKVIIIIFFFAIADYFPRVHFSLFCYFFAKYVMAYHTKKPATFGVHSENGEIKTSLILSIFYCYFDLLWFAWNLCENESLFYLFFLEETFFPFFEKNTSVSVLGRRKNPLDREQLQKISNN